MGGNKLICYLDVVLGTSFIRGVEGLGTVFALIDQTGYAERMDIGDNVVTY